MMGSNQVEKLDLVLDRLGKHWWHRVDEDGHDVPLTDVRALNHHGESPLHLAALMGTPADIECLVANGAEVNARGDVGMTPLHYAFVSANDANIRALLAAGADLQAATDFGLLPAGGATAEGLKAELEQRGRFIA